MAKRIAISVGEPAGIGPDILLLAHQRQPDLPIVAFANKALLHERAVALNIDLTLIDHKTDGKGLEVVDIPLNAPVTPGVLDTKNANYVLTALSKAWQKCLNGSFKALVTGPVQKSLLNDAGVAFSGHTEWLAQNTKTHPVMLFVQQQLKVALVTTHIPLSAVAAAINTHHLKKCINTLASDIKRFFGYEPIIKVCGLNPHAGECGHLGQEETTIIAPVIKELQQQGLSISGPYSADTIFLHARQQPEEIVLAMYHDQALPVIKTLDFHNTVNVTLGLPVLRTSVDHGTALSLAGTGQANPDSLLAAIRLAEQTTT